MILFRPAVTRMREDRNFHRTIKLSKRALPQKSRRANSCLPLSVQNCHTRRNVEWER
jgi:hypothetical protein